MVAKFPIAKCVKVFFTRSKDRLLYKYSSLKKKSACVSTVGLMSSGRDMDKR